MIVRKLKDVVGTAQDIKAKTWNSRRLLLARDGMGYSMHDTLIHAGTETRIWYQHHLEAVYCIEGDGEVITQPDGNVYPISAGTLYALDRHDHHLLRARTQMRMICVFNPPLVGSEVHDENGVYPASREAQPEELVK